LLKRCVFRFVRELKIERKSPSILYMPCHNTEKTTGLSIHDKTSECPFRVFIVVRYLYLRGGSLEGIGSFRPKSSLVSC
jgi:hypothetical protein